MPMMEDHERLLPEPSLLETGPSGPTLPGSPEPPLSCGSQPEESPPGLDDMDNLLLCFARTFRKYVEQRFVSHEEFLASTNINRGHFGEMANGKVDTKLSMVFRCTRLVGHCPHELLCELCVRFAGPCIVPFDACGVSPDVRTVRDLHASPRNPRRDDGT
jgi:hypothetical protein